MRDHWKNFIGGRWVDGSNDAVIDIENPSTGQSLATIARAVEADVDAAVAAARACVDERALTDVRPAIRGRWLLDLSTWLEDHRAQVAEVLALDSGKTLTEANWEIDNTTTFLTYYGGLADKIEGRYIPLGGSITDYIVPVPYGVSAHIVPWNYPLEIAARGAAPAIAAGNAVVIKSPELDPLSVALLAEGAEAVGMPAGAFNVICGFGHDAGTALSTHPDIDQITFTGSVETGKKILHAAAESIIPAAVELGGKSAGIVLPDADLELVAEQTRWAIFGNNGQICSALARLVVPADRHDEIVDAVVAKAEALVAGPAMDDLDMGPMISARQRDKVAEYVRIGVDEGAMLATGGAIREQDGWYFEPTVLANVDNTMRVAQEEIFGPVVTVIPYETLDDALAIANDSPYGLVAGVFGNDLTDATWLADRLDAGQIFVNDWFVPAVEAPFGGFKSSGFGREKGQAAVESYIQWKNVAITRL